MAGEKSWITSIFLNSLKTNAELKEFNDNIAEATAREKELNIEVDEWKVRIQKQGEIWQAQQEFIQTQRNREMEESISEAEKLIPHIQKAQSDKNSEVSPLNKWAVPSIAAFFGASVTKNRPLLGAAITPIATTLLQTLTTKEQSLHDYILEHDGRQNLSLTELQALVIVKLNPPILPRPAGGPDKA